MSDYMPRYNESTDYTPLDSVGDTTVDPAIITQYVWDESNPIRWNVWDRQVIFDPIVWIVDIYQGCYVVT